MATERPPFLFGIERILDCGFSVEEAESLVDVTEAQVGYAMNFSFNAPQNWIQYVIRVDFNVMGSKNIFMTGTVLTRFAVNNLSDFIDSEDRLLFPDGSLETLFGIAFGHLRAIVAKNAGGSKFSSFYVPVVNAKPLFAALLKESIERASSILKGTGSEITIKETAKGEFFVDRVNNDASGESKPKYKPEEKSGMEAIDLAPNTQSKDEADKLKKAAK